MSRFGEVGLIICLVVFMFIYGLILKEKRELRIRQVDALECIAFYIEKWDE